MYYIEKKLRQKNGFVHLYGFLKFFSYIYLEVKYQQTYLSLIFYY